MKNFGVKETRYHRRYRKRGQRMRLLRYNHWMASKPRCVRQLAARFPISTRVMLEGRIHYLLGYTEDGKLIISHIDPGRFYDVAIQERKYICAKHLERADA